MPLQRIHPELKAGTKHVTHSTAPTLTAYVHAVNDWRLLITIAPRHFRDVLAANAECMERGTRVVNTVETFRTPRYVR